MKKRYPAYVLIALVLIAATVGFVTIRSLSESELTVSVLSGETHFHGIAVGPGDPPHLYLATHRGV